MKNTSLTETRLFPVTIRNTPDAEPRVIEKVEVEVILSDGEEYLTPESNALIERIRAHHMGLMTGEDIKSMRKRLGLSQKELTQLLQCGEKSLSRWENGKGQPTGLVNSMLRLLDEGFIAPVSLHSVQGPRSQRWTPIDKKDAHVRKIPLNYKYKMSEIFSCMPDVLNQPLSI